MAMPSITNTVEKHASQIRVFGVDTEEVAVLKLSVAYVNLLKEFLTASRICLRMLPVSSGIFAGHLHLRMPAITAAALAQAISKLTIESQLKLDARSVEMCIFHVELRLPLSMPLVELSLRRRRRARSRCQPCWPT